MCVSLSFSLSLQQFFDNVVNTVGCAPEMTWSHRAPLEDGSQLDEDEEGDDTVIQVATGSDGEPGDDAPAENEEDKEPASLRPRSTTSKLPCTANDEYEKMKSRMWGRTRDARFGDHPPSPIGLLYRLSPKLQNLQEDCRHSQWITPSRARLAVV